MVAQVGDSLQADEVLIEMEVELLGFAVLI